MKPPNFTDPLVRQILGLPEPTGLAPASIAAPAGDLMPLPATTAVQRPVATPQASPAGMRASATMDAPEDRLNRSELQSRFKDLLLQQEQGLNRQQQDYDAFKQQPQAIDFRGLAAWSDSLYGGNLSAAAKEISPPDPEERQKILAAMEQSMNAQRNQMSNQLKGLVDSKNQSKMMDLMSKNQRFQEGQQFRLNQDLDKTSQNFSKDAFEKMLQFSPVEKALTPDKDGMVSAGAIGTVKSFAARALGEKGVLTDQDIARVIPAALEARIAGLESYLTGDPNQKIPATIVGPLTEALRNAKQAVGEVSQKRLHSAYQAYQARGGDVQTGQAIVGSYLDPIQKAYGSGGAAAPEAPAAKPSAGPPTPEEWLARRRAQK